MESIITSDQLKPRLLLFDIYETLLDMELLERRVNAILNSKRGYIYWFEVFMQYCFVDNSLSTYHPFSAIARSTLQMAGKSLGVNVSSNQADEVVELFDHLPLKEGITESLSQLYDLDFRIAALTNASQNIIENRMERTGLISYFEAVMSAEKVKRYKPAREVYEWAASQLMLQPGEILFISSHNWDIAGAANAGMKTAFLDNGNQLLYPLAKSPTLRVKNVELLAQQLKEAFS